MTHHSHRSDPQHRLSMTRLPPSPQITSLMDVRTYFDAAQRLGNAYSDVGSVRIDVLSVLQTPGDAKLPLRCEKIAQRVASTARARSRVQYWWSSYDAQTGPYRLWDLDRQQPREELIGNLQELCTKLQAPDATLADLAPELALMAMDLLRLSVAHDRHIRREDAAQNNQRSA